MNQFEKLLISSVLIRRITILLLILVIGWLDFATGYEYSFSVFYLLPVSVAAWFDHKISTVLTIVLAVTTRFYVDTHSGHIYVNSPAPYWNLFARLIFFSIVACLLLKVRRDFAAMTAMAMHDSLTSLNNSRALNLEYQSIHQRKYLHQQKVAIGVIDLDFFKSVNDTYGHSQGDIVLVEFSKILKETTRKTDFIARLGGDEFVIILKNTDRNSIQDYEKRLRHKFQQSQLQQKFGINFSMGIGIFRDLPTSLDDATHLADDLMYQSKQAGKSQTTISVV